MILLVLFNFNRSRKIRILTFRLSRQSALKTLYILRRRAPSVENANMGNRIFNKVVWIREYSYMLYGVSIYRSYRWVESWEGLLMLMLTDVSTTLPYVIFRVKHPQTSIFSNFNFEMLTFDAKTHPHSLLNPHSFPTKNTTHEAKSWTTFWGDC